MQHCKEFLIDVPDSFPLAAWQVFVDVGRQATSGSNEAWGEFIRAMGCVIYRYKTCKEAIESMIDYWHVCGKSLTSGGFYIIERDLFSFFSCGLSCIESLLYACYVVATQKHPAILNWSDLNARKWQSDPSKLSATLLRSYPNGHTLITEINSLTDKQAGSQEWKDWNGYRNTMIHRSLQTRDIRGSGGGPPPLNEMVQYAQTWSNPALVANESQMEKKLDWLGKLVEKISTAAQGL